MKLFIVESPSKSKTIEKYLGEEYIVKASVGHIRDLPKNNKKAIDIEKDFTPHYEISPGKEKVVAELQRLADGADEVILATDPDREGEAIAWHISELLNEANSKTKEKTKRVTFFEITPEAIKEALKNPRPIDENLKTAQEARRVLDRLFGYDLSGLIWKKVRYGLSAGRVQSPALRILMEKEREIRAFIPEKYFIISGEFKTEKKDILNLVCAEQPRDEKIASDILKKCENGEWLITSVKETETKKSPKAPFITSTLQQAASSFLGYSPSYTMSIAQKLYEAGMITYMRTDSTNINEQTKKQIILLIEKEYGKEYAEARIYKTKSKNAQEAHEAIRPTHLEKKDTGNTPEQKKLYRLIWERTISSQMADAKVLRTKISANITTKDIPDFTTNGSQIIFSGWLKVDHFAEKEDVTLPETKINEKLKLQNLNKEEKETTPPDRYSEAGLVKELEKRGIGRPSTYANIIKTIVDRGYVEKINRSLKPTDTGEVVSDFIEKNFTKYISDSFTSEMEDELDEIATGKRNYVKTLKDFYGPFTKEIKNKENMEKITNLGEADPKIKCPECGNKMVIKLSRNGKFLSCSKYPDCQGALTIEGKEMAKPKETGEKCPKCEGNLIEKEGRFGKFISCSNYPKCKFIKNDEAEEAKKKTGVICPECKTGDLTERRGKFGTFYSCSNYPKCKFAIKAKPTGKICDLCKSLMMEGTKTIPERCSNKSCVNHNPHKTKKTA